MEKPVITGAKFGLGFAVVFVLVTFALDYVRISVIDSLFPETTFGEPQIIRTETDVRDGVFVVLATVSNADEASIAFDVEAVIYDSDDEFLDTCFANRTFELAPSAELSFVATCSVGPEDETESATQIVRAALQFY